MGETASREPGGRPRPDRPRLLLVSGVLPFPGEAGQQQRVRNKILGFRERFAVSFLTAVPRAEVGETRERLLELCDEALVLESRYWRTPLSRLVHRLAAALYAAATGLKASNYVAGRLELSPSRVVRAVGGRELDVAVFEYWHAHRGAAALRRLGIPCVLDMHDLLWRSFRRQLAARRLPAWWRELRVRRYRAREEAAWRSFDALITINTEEHAYVRRALPKRFPLFYAPMGADLETWSFGPRPATPPRVAYYGGLATPHNQSDARRCFEEILPLVWRTRPDVELWLVGSRPPASLTALAEKDPRVRVTGFVDDAAAVLRTMTLVLCPWTGTYGFRSRLVEVMALGVPVVATPDAVSGMDLEPGRGIFLETSAEAMARAALRLLDRPELAREQSRRAREAVEASYSFGATYGRLTLELATWLAARVP